MTEDHPEGQGRRCCASAPGRLQRLFASRRGRHRDCRRAGADAGKVPGRARIPEARRAAHHFAPVGFHRAFVRAVRGDIRDRHGETSEEGIFRENADNPPVPFVMTERSCGAALVCLCACLMLADCSALPEPREASPRDVLPVTMQDSLIGRQLMGQSPNAPPLQPEPGDIWAGVLPTQPPVALTPPPSRQPVAGPDAIAGVGSPRHISERRPSRPTSADDAPAVHLATADTAQGAVAAWTKLQHRLRNLLRGHSPQVWAAEVNGRTVWRLGAAGFATNSDAHAFCARMHAAKVDCRVVSTAAVP